MQSSFNILAALYGLLNIPAITLQISGKVLIGPPSLKSQLEDIELKVVENVNKYLQYGKCEVNIYLPNINAEGKRDLQRFDELVNIINPLLLDVTTTTDKGSFYFQTGTDAGVFDDPRRDGMGYYSITIDFQTFKT